MKILIIQTAFIGDVILATSLIEQTHIHFPHAQIDFLLRKGNESIVKNNPSISQVLIWDKKNGKIKNLFSLLKQIRNSKYDHVLNIQRFLNSGFITAFSASKSTIGFKQNPLSFLFKIKIEHKIPYQVNDLFYHEVQRNLLLLKPLIRNFKMPEAKMIPPRLFITDGDEDKIKELIKDANDYIVLAPSSVWFTKQWAKEKWIELAKNLHQNFHLFFIGGPEDKEFIDSIIGSLPNSTNLCGKLNLIQSACLMKHAKRVFVNDSAPLHLASAVNAKTTAIFCSTVPEFGYTPLALDSKVIQLSPRISCMPCGLHGKKACPLSHFKCANDINIKDVISTIV